MSRKKKTTPTKAKLLMHYTVLDSRFKPHEGRIIPIEIYNTGDIDFIIRYMDLLDPGIIRSDISAKNPVRIFNMTGSQYQEPKLAWLYYTGTYPDTAILHKDGDRLNCKQSNLTLAPIRNATQSKSGVPGIYQLTTGYNAHMWVAYYIRNEYQELPIDENGKPLPQREFRTKGWHNRRTKVFNKRIQKLIGYYMTKERAIQAQKRYVNETLHPICRYRVDMKLKRLCATLMGMYPDSPSSATWHYLQLLYNRGVIDEAEALDYAEMLGHGSKVLPDRHTV